MWTPDFHTYLRLMYIHLKNVCINIELGPFWGYNSCHLSGKAVHNILECVCGNVLLYSS